ncbi:MAG: hypothetical protein IKK41_06115 [Oscillospiraceae bacterium]|nr:hypothetical protein [Oscillospiraceae bacterium]
MLYVSTKNKTDSFTAYRVLHEDKTPDGGLFAPFHLPVFSEDEIEKLKDQSFSETVAKILNLFFSRRLSSWDVEFSIGRYPFRLETIGQRAVVAELWHNNQSDYQYIVSSLYKKLSDKPCQKVPQWVCIAVEIAVLFGLFGELLRNGVDNADVALTDDVLDYPVAAWYARKMGLPIGSILCGCSENSGLWDFFRKGEASVNVSDEMQRLIYENFGCDEAVRFVEVRENGRIYRLTDAETEILRQGIYPSVIGAERIPTVLASINRTCGYTADHQTAAAYGAMQDYRAATGENRPTLLLSRRDPKE